VSPPAHRRRSSTERVLSFPRTALRSRRWASTVSLSGRPVVHLRRSVSDGLLPCPTRHLLCRKRREERIGVGFKNGEMLQLRADWVVLPSETENISAVTATSKLLGHLT
jgi:hypothetical protein